MWKPVFCFIVLASSEILISLRLLKADFDICNTYISLFGVCTLETMTPKIPLHFLLKRNLQKKHKRDTMI